MAGGPRRGAVAGRRVGRGDTGRRLRTRDRTPRRGCRLRRRGPRPSGQAGGAGGTRTATDLARGGLLMPLTLPAADERAFASLVADARSRLPRLAPAWTDYNVH